MLVRFSVANFMSFRDQTEFNMSAGKIIRHSDHVITKNGKRILKGSFLFGANASGKSNFISAIEFSRDIVINGLKSVSINKKHFRIEGHCKSKPGVFQFDIMSNNHFYSYGFAISYENAAIEEEWLYRLDDEICVFLRHKSKNEQTLSVDTDIEFTGERFKIYSEDFQSPKMNQILFLSDVVARSPDGEKEYQAFRDVMSWFRKLIIIFPTSLYGDMSQLLDDDNERTKLSKLLKYFDTGIADVTKKEIDFEKAFTGLPEKKIEDLKIDSLEKFQSQESCKRVLIPHNGNLTEIHYHDGNLYANGITTNHGNNDDLFEFSDESDGTQRLFHLLPVYQAAIRGRTIIVDELDRSLHTKATQEFIRYFFEVTDGIAAQLIATTQDSNIMDLDFLRQDEIWFVERQMDHSSSLYSLNQFKERFDKKIEKDYLLGRYGAIPIFKQFVFYADEAIEEGDCNGENN